MRIWMDGWIGRWSPWWADRLSALIEHSVGDVGTAVCR